MDPATIVKIAVGIISLIKSLGWWTHRDWYPELCGNLTDDSSTGEVINNLEALTGKNLSYLRTLLQEVVDAWRSFQRQWPSEETAKPYDEKVLEFASAVKEETEAWAKEQGIDLGGVGDWLKTNAPYLVMAGLGVSLIAILAVTSSPPTRDGAS